MTGVCFMNCKIRQCTDDDIPAVLELLYELGRPRPGKASDVDFFRRRVKNYIYDFEKEIIVSVIDDDDDDYDNNSNLVGMASMIFLPRLNRLDLEMYVPELVVQNKYKRMGIGRLLIDSCYAIGRERGCYRIRLESGNQRSEAHEFYKNLGFRQSAVSFDKDILLNV